MNKKLYDFNKLDKPLSFRVPHKLHDQYKSLSGYERKEIQFKFINWLKKQLSRCE
jgi:hypothetical protein